MNITEYTKAEMLKIQEKENCFPFVKRWYKNINKPNSYQYQLDIFELGNFEEVTDDE